MNLGWFWRVQWLHEWWYRAQARRASRLAAYSHLAMIAHAIWTGSTHAYTLRADLPREPDSTRVIW